MERYSTLFQGKSQNLDAAFTGRRRATLTTPQAILRDLCIYPNFRCETFPDVAPISEVAIVFKSRTARIDHSHARFAGLRWPPDFAGSRIHV